MPGLTHLSVIHVSPSFPIGPVICKCQFHLHTLVQWLPHITIGGGTSRAHKATRQQCDVTVTNREPIQGALVGVVRHAFDKGHIFIMFIVHDAHRDSAPDPAYDMAYLVEHE